MPILFQNVTAVLMDAERTVLKNAYVAVDGGKIASVGTDKPQGAFDRIIDGHGGILMPGLVNAHTHVPMTAMRGYGDGHDLHDWLHNFIFPVEAKWDDRAVRACADLGLMEMIASGTTCLCDMYMRTNTVAQAIADAGLSANVGVGAVFFGEKFSESACADCKNQDELFKAWHGFDGGRMAVDSSLHAEYTSPPALAEWIAGYAKDHGTGVNVHVSETKKEHEECKQRHGGLTPIQYFAKCGMFDVRATAAHCVWTERSDWAIMADKGVTAVHNPASNLKLGSGVAPIVELLKAGVNVALGTDGVSSNNTTDMFEDMKLSAILQNGVRQDPLALTAWDALEFATVNGARALGRTDTGSIQVGKWADLILLDAGAVNLFPCHDAANNIAYAAHGCNVKLNMCRGNVIYENGTFLTIDADKARREMEEYALPLLFGK